MKKSLVKTMVQGDNTVGQVSNPLDLMKAQGFAHDRISQLTHDFVNSAERPEVTGFTYELGLGLSFNITIKRPGRVYTQDGISYDLLADPTLTFAAADDVLPRIDLVVAVIEDEVNAEVDLIPFVRLRTAEEFAADPQVPQYPAVDISAPTELHWRAVPRVITGTPAATPAAPGHASNEVPLYQIAIGAGASQLLDADVLDLRDVLKTIRELHTLAESSGTDIDALLQADIDQLAAIAAAQAAADAAEEDAQAAQTTANSAIPESDIGISVQAHDGDLTDLAALDSATAGMPASDGAGWIKKTYAQVKTAIGLGSADNKSSATIRGEITSGNVTGALGYTPVNPNVIGAASGLVPLNASTKIAATYLPAFVDVIVEYANLAAFPGTGASGTQYLALDTNKVYRWSGTVFVEISASPGSTDAVTEGSANLYFTAARVLAVVLAGLSLATGTAITGADTVLSALGKLQKQITDLIATVGAIVSNVTHTGDVTGSTALTIANNAVTNVKADDMATKTYKGRTSAATGNPEDVPVATLKADLALHLVNNTPDTDKPVSAPQQAALDEKQDTLVSGENIKTVGGESILGAGNLEFGRTEGVYTPTLYNEVNVAASIASPTRYFRAGNWVWLQGTVFIDAVSPNAYLSLGISLPIASNFVDAGDLGGHGNHSIDVQPISPRLAADPANNRLNFSYTTNASASSLYWQFQCTYQVL